MLKKIIIVGGGFAGWYTAATLQYNTQAEILIIDSDKHPTVGVGETTGWSASIDFARLVGIKDNNEFMRETGAIYKYGVRAVDFFQDNQTYQWGKFPNLKVSALTNFYNKFDYIDFEEPGNHQDGDIGATMAWLKLNQHSGKKYIDFALECGEQEHFISNPVAPFLKDNRLVINREQGMAYNIDAEKTSAYLRSLVLSRNNGSVKWITNTVTQVNLDSSNNIDNLILEDGTKIKADLFIDASGLRRVLMSNSRNDSWQASSDQYCNAAWVVPSHYTNPEEDMLGISEFFGEDWGWRFKVRLYHRIGNGYVFNTNQVDPEIPLQRLLEITNGTRFVEPKLIKWNPGQYKNPWQGNLLPLGMSSEFIDPYDAPTFDAHGRALEDLVKIINQPPENYQDHYNQLRNLTKEERLLRLNLTFGLSKRRGPFWDSRRQMASDGNYVEEIKKIILGQRTDIESRMPWHWHHMYIRNCLATDLDMSDWEFPDITDLDRTMVESFFAYNRARNQYISKQPWTNYYQWLKKNIFHGLTNQDVLKKLNPQFGRNYD